MFGEQHTVDNVVRMVEEDGVFYSRSGGGITVSGGEPLFQSKFVSELLRTCRERGINTAVETSGYAKWDDVEKVCAYADLIMYDIKHIDPKKHKAFTGVTNKLILENIKKISCRFPSTPIIARTVIVPGFTDSEDNIKGIVEFLREITSLKQYVLLPYHGFGEPKYCQLGRSYPLTKLVPPSEERMEALMKIVRESSIGKSERATP
ncbi:putative [Formate-C-acetyltransferase]-activating enzyme [Georgfuchsia toluolica]|uniref:[Formate-C-acetyltransferase]-activating enzyme n=2 Tax=Georgfuchsia toluolica TaxID=424218 RepID=A0A916J709_9PROT|nr:putative [Formate-C-acetyltransferase]-activating enzyme [Georgfuchsia toluolica]